MNPVHHPHDTTQTGLYSMPIHPLTRDESADGLYDYK